MTNWVLQGLRTGIVTTGYPNGPETTGGVSPGRPGESRRDLGTEIDSLISCCPTGALGALEGQISVDYRRCIHCYRCIRGFSSTMGWDPGYEWAGSTAHDQGSANPLGKAFTRSLHIRLVDAGACGACISELEQTAKPHYNLHRLGFFVTPTPREADILLVAGPGTDHMRLPLTKTYHAMPSPKRVIAVGACALSGGIFGRNFVSSGGVSEVIPVDVGVPGCPPPPLAILHALLVAVGRRPLVPLIAPQPAGGRRKPW
jgi:Ni,Fe-hydrogenase III small subunit